MLTFLLFKNLVFVYSSYMPHQLRSLDVSYNPNFSVLPDFLVSMSSLVHLDARQCNISSLSVIVGQWTRLQTLLLDGMEMDGIVLECLSNHNHT